MWASEGEEATGDSVLHWAHWQERQDGWDWEAVETEIIEKSGEKKGKSKFKRG